MPNKSISWVHLVFRKIFQTFLNVVEIKHFLVQTLPEVESKWDWGWEWDQDWDWGLIGKKPGVNISQLNFFKSL